MYMHIYIKWNKIFSLTVHLMDVVPTNLTLNFLRIVSIVFPLGYFEYVDIRFTLRETYIKKN